MTVQAGRPSPPAGGDGEIEALIAALRAGTPVTPELVNRYYTLCIPFYREFLGDHWHTGWYAAEGAIGPDDQLAMEQVVGRSAGLDADCEMLDVGCGVGGPACHLARISGARVRGLTPNATQRRIAHERAARLGLSDRVGFDLGHAGALPYPDASFDVVLFFESACHFPDRARFFAEAFRVLRPGGRLAGEDWLACESLVAQTQEAWTRRICSTWAIPSLGTVSGYAASMSAAGFGVAAAVDLRGEMALARGFMTDPAQRAAVRRKLREVADPIRRFIMEGLLVLGEATQAGAFTVGRFLAHKPGAP